MATRFAADRFVYVFSPDKRLTSGAGIMLDVFVDQACTVPATITTLTGEAIPGARLVVSDDSLIPEFLDAQNRTTLFVRPPNATGNGSAIYSMTTDMVETLLDSRVGSAVSSYLDANPPEAEVLPSDDEGNLLILGSDDRIFLSADALPPGATGDHGDLTGLEDDDHPQYLNDTRGDVRYYPRGQVDSLLGGKVSTSDPRLSDARTPTAHVHSMVDVTGLSLALEGKVNDDDARLSDARTPTSHSHVVGDVTGLQDVLNGFVTTSDPRLTDARTPTMHSHVLADVTGLSGELDGKAPTIHSHELVDVTGLTQALGDKADAEHAHEIGDVNGLQGTLDGKANAEHDHAIANITGLQNALDAKQPSGSYASASHTHSVGDISASGTASSTTFLRGDGTWATPAGEGGTTDHGSLTGLGDDDHPQYLTNARGDARYYTQGQVDAALSGKVGTSDPRLSDARTPTSHVHPISDVTDLSGILGSKSNTGHTHDSDDLSDATTVGKAVLTAATAAAGRTAIDAASSSHTHTIANVTDLQNALDAKQASGDYATNSALSSGLSGKANISHTHDIGDTTGLQDALDAKAASSHTHTIANVTGLQNALDGKSATGHSHEIGDISSLQLALDGKQVVGDYATNTALAGKADVEHTHAIADTTGLQSALNGKAASSHSHEIGDITATGTAGETTFLRGDGSWAIPPGTGEVDLSSVLHIVLYDLVEGWDARDPEWPGGVFYISTNAVDAPAPADGIAGDVWVRHKDATGGGSGGNGVTSVNGQTGVVVLDADDVGARPDDWTPTTAEIDASGTPGGDTFLSGDGWKGFPTAGLIVEVKWSDTENAYVLNGVPTRPSGYSRVVYNDLDLGSDNAAPGTHDPKDYGAMPGDEWLGGVAS